MLGDSSKQLFKVIPIQFKIKTEIAVQKFSK